MKSVYLWYEVRDADILPEETIRDLESLSSKTLEGVAGQVRRYREELDPSAYTVLLQEIEALLDKRAQQANQQP